MKLITTLLLSIALYLLFHTTSYAIYDPTGVKNNKFGIHILFPEEISEASHLVNSNGGDWGYVTIPIRSSDRDLDKWQTFMDNCKRYRVIPIIRIATEGDYFNKSSWSKPTEYDILDFANFLNSLSWPTKNRYIVVFNEVNRADEWGGSPNPDEYTKILSYAVDIFKEKSTDFFIIMGGLDNASANIYGQSIEEFVFMEEMQQENPEIFKKIDGISSHSYPNPGFSSPPSQNRMGIYSFYYQKQIGDYYSGKDLPIFITETGWSSDTVPYASQAKYYIQAFNDYWNKEYVVAVTPFLFNASAGDFSKFSFLRNGQKSSIYQNYINFPKVKGEPTISKENLKIADNQDSIPTVKFLETSNINSVFKSINKSSNAFFKWLLSA